MGRLTTHVLDTAAGVPAAGVEVTLYRLGAAGRERLKTVHTDEQGRCGSPLLEGAAMTAGRYELVFAVGDYFAARGTPMSEPRFLDRVPLAFGIADPHAHYHVPLLISPWSYGTYRGS